MYTNAFDFLQFVKKCLFCGRPNSSINYSCACSPAAWHDEYRTLDLELFMEAEDQEVVRDSFRAYAFDHPQGMLQYAALPFREYAPDGLEPVGMTPLYHLENFSKRVGCRVFIKNEGDNPSGCFKDRESLMCLLNTRRRHLNHATIYSSGNAAASAALLAQKQGLELITIVAGDTYPEKIDFIRDHGTAVIVIGNEETTFEDGFRMFAHLNREGVFARSGYDNWSVRNPYRAQGDKTTAVEIVKQFIGLEEGDPVPEYILIPSANGTHLVGIWKGFKELEELGIIDSLPKMIPVGMAGANPIYEATEREETHRPARCDLSGLDERDLNIGSTIIAEEGYDSVEASKAVLESRGFALEVHADDIREAMIGFLSLERDLATEYDILPEPTSYIALAAISALRERDDVSPADRVVAMITGHGLKALDLTLELLEDEPDLQRVVNHIALNKERTLPDKADHPGPRIDVPADFDQVSEAFSKMKKQVP